MNIALITAGGNGTRMHQDIPKQFLNVNNKPIIVYTMEAFQNHPDIDAIEVVCLDGWHQILEAYAKQFNITKLVGIVSGGKNGQESIKNGLNEINKKYSKDDIVIVHDGNRPLVSEEIISDSIAKCLMYGSGIAAIPCVEAMLETDDRISSNKQISRDNLMRTQTPHAFKLEKLLWAHEEAEKMGIKNSVASCTLMLELGEKIYFSAGSEKNIKLTTPVDIEIFKALLNTQKDIWMK
ncbi:MAG: 2-C-methyl-D-erythritol 4-phosphate cytidylyltransferase [Clostridia bacterium]